MSDRLEHLKRTMGRCCQWALFALFCLLACPLRGGEFDITADDVKRLRADSWRIVGKNILVEGNVYLPVRDLEIYADKVILNLESRDFEAAGNIRIYRWQNASAAATLSQIAEFEKSSGMLVQKVTSSQDLMGKRSYQVTAAIQRDNFTADRVAGNLNSAYFRFDNVQLHYATFVCRAKSAEQLADGVTLLKDAEVSACPYLESNNGHYSIAAKEIKLMPHETVFYGVEHMDLDQGDRTIILNNGFVKIYGIPVLWLPFFYKPKDESLGLASITWGRKNTWGYYISFSRKFDFSEYPSVYARPRVDWYEKRGVGYGVAGDIATEESYTDFFAYSIYDLRPNETDDYRKYRLKVPSNRYNFRLSNLTHLTPRLDFRGSFEYSSDRYFRRDFFSSRYDADPQPATFVALEQQFDHLSAAVYMRLQVNDFYSTVEKLPEVRLDVPRTQIANTGLYYQGDAVFDNFRMKWLLFDYDPEGYSVLKDYQAVRFDTTHFFYYPINNRYFNLIPRAGVKMTAYSNSSDTEISDEELVKMFVASDPQSMGTQIFKNYDKNGGATVRFAAELGVELSTKIHNTWQNVRNSFFELDGVRHIMQPYINYTYIAPPTKDKEHLYYFDDVDRISKQNFVRFGLLNRLQTRKGSSVDTFLSMENFWDLHFEEEDGFSRLGNFGTLLRLKLFKGLSMHTQFLIDTSGDGKVPDTYRNGRNAGQVGLALKWLNQWNIGVTFKPIEDWEFTVSYNYQRPYSTRSAYSMGSTLTQINSTSYYNRYYTQSSENFSVGGKFPITPDRRTLGMFNIVYDVQKGSWDTLAFTVTRKFHCWQLIGMLGFERTNDNGDKYWETNYSLTANLTGLNAPMNEMQNSVLRTINDPENSVVKF